MNRPSSFATVLLACVGCESARPATSVTEITGAEIVRTESALDEVRDAICVRERACGNVGAGRKFADDATCSRLVDHSALRDRPCSGGVASARLASCASEIQNARCDLNLDRVARYPRCGRRTMCADSPEHAPMPRREEGGL